MREELLTSLASWPVVTFVCCNMCHNYSTVLKLSMTKITMMTMMLIETTGRVDIDHLFLLANSTAVLLLLLLMTVLGEASHVPKILTIFVHSI